MWANIEDYLFFVRFFIVVEDSGNENAVPRIPPPTSAFPRKDTTGGTLDKASKWHPVGSAYYSGG